MAEHPSDQAVYELLTRALGRPPHPALWDHALRARWIDDVRAEVASGVSIKEVVRSLAKRYKDMEHVAAEMARPSPRAPTEARIGPDHRAQALARILAADASRLREVRWFRRQRLHGRVVELSRVPEWILRRRRRSAPQVFKTVPTDAAAMPEAAGGRSWQVRTLSYLTGQDPFPRVVALGATGTLVELKTIASHLVVRYSWTEAEATTFVLTGLPPALPLVRGTINVRSPWLAASTISLEVHPSTTPAALAGAYRAIRPEAVAPKRRYRKLKEPHRGDLAAFCAENNDGRSWARMMQTWNAHDPAHRYHDVRRFTRDAREAYEMIAGERLEWAGHVDRGRRRRPPGT